MIVLAVLFFSGFLLVANGCQSAIGVGKAECVYDYEEYDGEVLYKRAGGEVVRIGFGKNAVTVYEAYKHSGAVYEIVAFIYDYGAKNGYEIVREELDFIGEVKLHNLLYNMGYQQKRTQDADVEYTADSRWYVNVISRVLG